MPILTNYCEPSQDHKQKIINYVQGLPLNDLFRKEIIAFTFIDEVLPFYTHYPGIFAAAFSIREKVEMLNIAGYLYHRSIIYLDRLLDEQSSESMLMLLSTICQEECIKILVTIYPLGSEFWKIWNLRRNEYLQALQVDKVTHRVNSYEDFEQLADDKSAFGKISIDCLYLLSEQKDSNLYHALLQSHRYFYCAMQILDDINDLREDLKNKQFNFALAELRKELAIRKMDYDLNAPADMSKLLFITGTAERLFDMAIEYLNKSSHVVMGYQTLEEWKCEISRLNNVALTKKLNVKAFIKKSIAEQSLSTVSMKNLSLNSRLQSSVDFILRAQNEDGSWNEFFNEAGTSDIWATAFIVFFLKRNALTYSSTSVAIEKGVSFLRENLTQGKWAYNSDWIPDADSGTFVQLVVNDERCASQQIHWLTYQKENGGFSTYNSEKDILASLNWEGGKNDVTGWTAPHFCVSVVAFYFLKKEKSNGVHLIALEKYITKKLMSGEGKSYWWSSPVYSISFLVRSLPYLQDGELKDLIIDAATEISAQEANHQGLIDNSTIMTALWVEALCSVPSLQAKYSKEIANWVQALATRQMSDGSWESTNDLVIPSPETLLPEPALWPVATRGMNIRPLEFNRLFTSSVCTSAIAGYINLITHE